MTVSDQPGRGLWGQQQARQSAFKWRVDPAVTPEQMEVVVRSLDDRDEHLEEHRIAEELSDFR